MAKALDWVSMNVNGDQDNPAAGNSASFTYCVKDGDLSKCGTYTPDPPDYADSVNTFWDEAVTAIKAAEGIS